VFGASRIVKLVVQRAMDCRRPNNAFETDALTRAAQRER